MKKMLTQQEILLMTGSNFFQHQLCEKNEQDGGKNMSQNEKLEEACWNGLLPELLPGLITKSFDGKALLLWQIKHANAFMEFDLCETPCETDAYYSVDPYLFLQAGFSN